MDQQMSSTRYVALACAGATALYAAGALYQSSKNGSLKLQKRGSRGGRLPWIRSLRRDLLQTTDINVTFDDFPYFLEKKTSEMLRNAAFIHLKHSRFRSYAKCSPALLLSGDAGTQMYQEAITKALARHYDAKLLLLDVAAALTQAGMQNGPIWGPTKKPMEAAVAAAAADVVDALTEILTTEAKSGPIVCFIRDVQDATFFDEKLVARLGQKLRNLPGQVFVIGSHVSCSGSANKGVEENIAQLFPSCITLKAPTDEAVRATWNKQMESDMKTLRSLDNLKVLNTVMLHGNVACPELAKVQLTDCSLTATQAEEVLGWAVSHQLMNCKVPQLQDGALLLSHSSLEYGLKLSSAYSNASTEEVKPQGQTEPKELQDSAGKVDVKVTPAKAEAEPVRTENPKLEPLGADLKAGGDVGAKGGAAAATPTTPPPKKAPVVESPPDNEFEKRIRPEVIPPEGVGVTFESIGALDNVKEALRELVMLPLQRPELFNRGGLIQPCKGILLFGPPGTGKTMLAKAVATEAGANFINISMSTITSKWFGEDEKNVRALFTLAAKIAPTVIFIDEVDSMLGRRSRAGEHEAMRKIKNEFMTHWDGLLSRGSAGVLVLAATNRPFDLDEAIIRRFQRRIMVGLPDVENREKILRSILAKEALATDFDFKELAALTEGHSGSDLKNLCITAAYRPIRELLEAEKKRKAAAQPQPAIEEKGDAKAEEEAESGQKVQLEVKEKEAAVEETKLRALCMEDLRQAKSQFAASVATEGASMAELQEWNDLYGEGGSRKKTTLSYFL